ncbi:hypothetical protein, partial [Moraxella sp. Pampa]|uniref:hypothetical protein n=1 Tax=Moraxella sp. Pampa TaxID=3111978 RepID=UPI002B403229
IEIKQVFSFACLLEWCVLYANFNGCKVVFWGKWEKVCMLLILINFLISIKSTYFAIILLHH